MNGDSNSVHGEWGKTCDSQRGRVGCLRCSGEVLRRFTGALFIAE
jgi:hypothetical protein